MIFILFLVLLCGYNAARPGNKKAPRAMPAESGRKTACLPESASLSLEAGVTVNRTILLGLERNLCCGTALGANSVKHLSGSALSVLLCLTAAAAAAGLILQTLFCIEFLLTGGENEFCSAIFAN